jgi:two-component system NtrC family sensor kinase
VKVASKVILVACLAFLPILGVDTWLSLRREEALFRSDMERDLSVLAAHLRGVAEVEWGRERGDALAPVLDAAADADSRVTVEWHRKPVEAPGVQERGGALVWVEPVRVGGRSVGEIVLTEPLAPMHAYLRSTLVRLWVRTFLLIAGGLIVARLLSHRLIGRRLDRLVAFAAETGSGMLGRRVDVGGHDEITRLGTSLGTMSQALAKARQEAERSNDERLTMLEHLRHADRLATLGRLAGSVAHELGTPLNVVMGHANRISEGVQSPGETKESAATIHRQVKRMETTIRDVLGFVRQAPGEEKEIDLNAVVESVGALLLPLARRRGVRLEVEGTPVPASVRGREVALEQALSNLVANAIDASPEGGRIAISLAREERVQKAGGRAWPVVVARVSDQGPGVAEADIARLFDAFYTSKAAGQGTGLGLWLAEGIVRDHGGAIEVGNLEAGGACFAMVLPASEVEGSGGPCPRRRR